MPPCDPISSVHRCLIRYLHLHLSLNFRRTVGCWNVEYRMRFSSAKSRPFLILGKGPRFTKVGRSKIDYLVGSFLTSFLCPRHSEYSLAKKVSRECEVIQLPLDSILSTRKVVALLIYTKLVHESLIYPVLEICDSDSYAESRKAISGGVTRCLRFASEEATCRGASSHNAKRHFYPPWEGKSRF